VLPDRPRRIGILAGAGTAGAADLDALLQASGHDWRLVRRPVPIAGGRAADAVAGGIGILADLHPDVIVVARGGGAAGEVAWADTPRWRQPSPAARCPMDRHRERWYRVDVAESGGRWQMKGPTEAGRQFVVADPDGYLWRPFHDLGMRPAAD
jgi:hypothetical protein